MDTIYSTQVFLKDSVLQQLGHRLPWVPPDSSQHIIMQGSMDTTSKWLQPTTEKLVQYSRTTLRRILLRQISA